MAVNGQAPGPYISSNAWREAGNSDRAPRAYQMEDDEWRPQTQRASPLWGPMRDRRAKQPCLLPLLCNHCPLKLVPFLTWKDETENNKASGASFLWSLRNSLHLFLEISKFEPENKLLTVYFPGHIFSGCACVQSFNSKCTGSLMRRFQDACFGGETLSYF